MNMKPHPTEHQSVSAQNRVQMASLLHQTENVRNREASARPDGGEYRFLYWE